MIRGLTWANVGWLALFFVILIMTISADGPWQLNWAIGSGAFNKIQEGFTGLSKASGKAAQNLDIETQKRYGYDPIEPRAASCATTPSLTGRIGMTDVVKAKASTNRVNLIKLIGSPYCKESTGYEIWLVGTAKTFQAGVDPKTQQFQLSIKSR